MLFRFFVAISSLRHKPHRCHRIASDKKTCYKSLAEKCGALRDLEKGITNKSPEVRGSEGTQFQLG